MKATNTPFNYGDPSESVDRIKTILNASNDGFEERSSIPSSDSLTFENGFYVYCSALFIDIRGSSNLPDKHKNPVLAKIYSAYISESIAVMNSDANCREVFINGDCVYSIVDTPKRADIDRAFESAAMLNSLVGILNWQLEKKNYTHIQCGIGLAYGRALMRKAGFKGSEINDIVWMGDVVNEASNLCGRGSKDDNAPVQVSPNTQRYLNDKYKGYLTQQYDPELQGNRYEGYVVNKGMNDWLTAQKEQERVTQGLADALRNTGLFGLPAPRPSLGGLLTRNMRPAPVTPFTAASTSLRDVAGLGRPSLLSGLAPPSPNGRMLTLGEILSSFSEYPPKK